jgi:hypothetical protein
MFNTTVFAPQRRTTEYVTKEIHEHRAPTDDSVRLLREMEGKAKEQIIEALHIGDTTFDCVVHVSKRFEDSTTRLLAVFSLNGKKLTAEHIEHDHRYERDAAFAALRDAIAKEIATEVLVPALSRLRI